MIIDSIVALLAVLFMVYIIYRYIRNRVKGVNKGCSGECSRCSLKCNSNKDVEQKF